MSTHGVPSRARPLVLLVDDEPAVLEVASLALQRDGYAILTATSGEEALRVSQEYSGDIHVLVTDVEMPSMDGWRLRECIQQERPGILVLVMSGSPGPQIEGVPFLAKPFTPSLLRDRVRQLLSRPRRGVRLLAVLISLAQLSPALTSSPTA